MAETKDEISEVTVTQLRNLVLVRAGDDPLPEMWLRPEQDRNFSLAVSYYGNQPERWSSKADRVAAATGPKWGPLADFIDENWDWVSKFDFVALPDDDIGATASDWKSVFRAMEDLNLDLAQPALASDSFWTHGITARRPAFRARITNFVEVMTPVFSRWALERLLPTFRLSPSGWGLDVIWPAILHGAGRKVGIVDEVAVCHSRPFNGPGVHKRVGANVYGTLHHPPQIDDMALMQLFGIAYPYDPVVFEAVESGSETIRV